jgi:hypothetical protein
MKRNILNISLRLPILENMDWGIINTKNYKSITTYTIYEMLMRST